MTAHRTKKHFKSWTNWVTKFCLIHHILLLLSRFSRVRLCTTPWTAAHEAPLSLGFSSQEHWSGLPFPSPMHESESEVVQSCPTLRDPMDCSLPGSSVHGIFQAGVLEWGAIAFSDILLTSYQSTTTSSSIWTTFCGENASTTSRRQKILSMSWSNPDEFFMLQE